MSNFTLNPMSILDNTAMGGFRAGMADQRGLMHSDSALESERLAQEGQGLINEKRRLDTPMDAAKRAQEIAQAEADLGLINDGTYGAGKKSEADLKAAQAIAAMDTNQRKQMEDQADAHIWAKEFIGEKGPAFAAANWDKVAERMDKAGVKGFPRTWSPEVQQRLDQASKAAWRTMKVVQDENLQGIKHRDNVTEAELKYNQQDTIQQRRIAADKEIAAGKNAARERAAATTAAAKGDTVKVGGTLEKAKAKIAAGEALTEGELDILEAELREKAKAALSGSDLGVTLSQMEARAVDPETKPEERAAAEQKVEAAYDSVLKRGSGGLWEKIKKQRAQLGGKKADRTVVKRGTTKDGKRVVMYSDGSVEPE